MSIPAPEGVVLSLDAPSRVRLGAEVSLTVRAVNTGSATATLYLRGREPTVELVVSDEAGTVWRSLEGVVVPALLRLESLPPGDTLRIVERWRPTRTGRYEVTALLLGETEPYRTPSREIAVEP